MISKRGMGGCPPAPNTVADFSKQLQQKMTRKVIRSFDDFIGTNIFFPSGPFCKWHPQSLLTSGKAALTQRQWEDRDPTPCDPCD